MANIVQQTSKINHVDRSTFDLSGNINLTAAPGMLVPIRVDDVLPNSSYHYNMSLFARTLQMVVPSFARVRAHIDTFFVPYRLLGVDIPSVLVGDERGIIANYGDDGVYKSSSTSLPYFRLPASQNDGKWDIDFGDDVDAAGVKCSISSKILLNSLGYGIPSIGSWAPLGDTKYLGANGDIVSKEAYFNTGANSLLKLNPLFLLSYQKIYQDHYRNKLWEKENRLSYYVRPKDMSRDITSIMKTTGAFEMRYHDYDKDRLTGVVPDENGILSDGISQYASTLLSASHGLNSDNALGNSVNPITNPKLFNQLGDEVNTLYGGGTETSSPFAINDYGVIQTTDDSVDSQVLVQQYTAITNKRMEAFQRFAEICQLNKSDYKHQIKAHFGFTPNDINSDYSSLIGSFDVNLSISDVENTNGVNDDGTLGYLGGKGTMSGQSREISFNTSSDYGCIMSILYILPQIDWSNEFVDRANLRFNRYDYAIPEFDHLGFEPVRYCDYFGFVDAGQPNYTNDGCFDIVGYLPRYWYYKTRLDVNTTGFTSSSMSSLNFNSYIVQYQKWRLFANIQHGTFFEALKCPPSQLDGLFPVNWSSPEDNPFIFTIYIGCKALLPLSIDSLPY